MEGKPASTLQGWPVPAWLSAGSLVGRDGEVFEEEAVDQVGALQSQVRRWGRGSEQLGVGGEVGILAGFARASRDGLPRGPRGWRGEG